MKDVSLYDWLVLGLGFLGFLVTWTGGIAGVIRAVGKIKDDTSAKVAAESKAILARITTLVDQFNDEQKLQDQRYGEVAAAMRQKIADVEKEMHQIEIWGRDNYVLKSEFIQATDQIREDIKEMAADIKFDLRRLADKIEANRQD